MNTPVSRTYVLFVNVLVLCVCLILLELALRATSYGSPATRPDPFFGFPGTNALFQMQDIPGQSSRYIPAPNKRFLRATFLVKKPSNAYRIFALGGSTTQGQPYGDSGSFPFWLEQELRLRHPDKVFEVLNVGIRGFGSSRVLQVLREVVHYEPDLILVYTGQNEFQDARFHPYELRRSEREAEILEYALRSRLLYFARQLLVMAMSGARQISYGGERIARVVQAGYSSDNFRSYDYFTVPELKVLPPRLNNSRDSAVRAANPKQSSFIASLKEIVKRTFRVGWIKIREPDEVFAIFQKNVAKMIETAKRARVPIIFIKKAINLQDRNVLTRIRYTIRADENRLGRWLTYYRSGVDNLRNSRYSAALLDLQAVSDLSVVEPPAKNDRLLMLYLGRAYEASGLFDRAITTYESRMDAYHLGLNRVLDETATEYGVPVIDAYRHLKNDSPTGIVGYNYFVDGVHMTWKGYKVLGTALAAFIEDYGYLPPGSANHEAEGPNTIQDKVKTLIQSPNAEVQTALGWSAFNQGDPYSAVNLATAAVEMDREDKVTIQAHLLLVYAYTKLGNFGHAESSWRDLKRIYLKLVDQEARHAGRR